MTTVAVVDSNALTQALDLIGGINSLNLRENIVTIKVGIYNPETGICTTVNTLSSIINSFNRVREILVVESDSGAGPGLQRLEIWNDCYTEKAIPFNLSSDSDTRDVEVAGENVPLSHVLFKPNILVSTHVPRRYESAGDEDLMNIGSIIKNLLGLIPDKKKQRFHDRLQVALLDMYEAIGGIDLAIMDATRVFLGKGRKRATLSLNKLIVGRDAFAVEATGAYMVGFDPTEMPVLKEAKKRGLGEINTEKIEISGDIETPRNMIAQEFIKL